VKKLFSCAVFILLAGCATSAKYEAVLGSWVGSSELDIVRSWGPPAQAYEAGGRKFLVYSSSRNVVLPVRRLLIQPILLETLHTQIAMAVLPHKT